MLKVMYSRVLYKLLAVLIFTTIISGFAISSKVFEVGAVQISDTESVVASVTVPVTCTLTDGGGTYSATMNPGTTTTLTGNQIKINCNSNTNNSHTYSIYAIGYSGDSYYNNNTDLIATLNTANNIKTDGGSGASYWKMKISFQLDNRAPETGIYIENNYNNYNVIPSDYIKILSSNYGNYAIITPSYQVYSSQVQAPDTYVGQVKYVIVNPASSAAPTKPIAPPETCNTPVPNITYMQDINSSNKSTVLASLTEDAPYYLYDKRDGEPYCVSKLQDGNLWMLDNLRLDLIDTDLATLKGQTNASDTSLEYLKGVQSRDPNTDASGNYATSGVSDAWTSSSQNYYSIPMVNMSNKDTIGSTSQQWGNGSHKYGGYYNFCAASAGSYCYGDGTSAGTSVGNATEDICPAGWRMPTGGASGEYQNLCNAILGSECASTQSMTPSDTTSLQYKLSTPLSGTFSSGAANTGGDGHFWSSTRYSNGLMLGLTVRSSSNIYTQDYESLWSAKTVRCLVN